MRPSARAEKYTYVTLALIYVENRTKIANFSTPRVFNAPVDGDPLGILYRRRGLRKLE